MDPRIINDCGWWKVDAPPYGDNVVSAGKLPVALVGHLYWRDDMCPFLAASSHVTKVLFLILHLRSLYFDRDNLVGRKSDSLDYVGVEDRGIPQPSKGWQDLSGGFP